MKIPPEDCFTQRLTEIRDMGLQWADTAKQVIMIPTFVYFMIELPQTLIVLSLWLLKYVQVSADGGVLGLDRVFELISKGECLPVSCEKELKVIKHCNTIMAIALYCYPEIVVGAVIEGSEHALLHLSETL